MIADVLAWSLFVGLPILGITLTVQGTSRAYQVLRTNGTGVGMSATSATAVAVVLFLGGSPPLGIYRTIDWALRVGRRRVPSVGSRV
jgi:hypothetical protein